MGGLSANAQLEIVARLGTRTGRVLWNNLRVNIVVSILVGA